MSNPEITVLAVDDDWDGRINNFTGKTFFDSGKWLDTFSWKADQIHKLLFKKGKKVVAALSFSSTAQSEGSIALNIPHSASHGGLLFKDNLALVSVLEIVQVFIRYVEEKFGPDFTINYIQRLEYISGHPQYAYEEFALLKNGFVPKEQLLEQYISLESMSLPSQTMRNQIRNNADVLTISTARMDEFVVFRNMIIEQQDKIRTLPDEELVLSPEASNGNITVYKCTYEGATISMLLSDQLNKSSAVARNWYQDSEYKHLNSTGSLIWEWLNILKESGVKYAGFGASAGLNFDLDPGLVFFKERFKPQAAFRRIFSYDSKN